LPRRAAVEFQLVFCFKQCRVQTGDLEREETRMKAIIKTAFLSAAVIWSANAYAEEGSAEHGKAVFNASCKVCHAVGPGAKAGVGPEQNNLVGAKAGSRPGYNYSAAMKEAGEKGLAWSPENLDKFIETPRAVVPGTKMVFPGLKNAKDRADLIAYLETQHGS
jgi:cytochrome c